VRRGQRNARERERGLPLVSHRECGEMGDEAAAAEPVSSNYVRVKRKKTTIFLYVDTADTSHDLRAKINQIMKVPTTDIKFFLDRNGELPIDEHKSPADMKVENDQELFMIYKKEGTEEWEEIDIGVSDSGKPPETPA